VFTLNEAAITGVFLTACVINVIQNDGWSKAYCPSNLCIKYRAVDREMFCSIDNFKASYKKANPILIVFVLPEKDGVCTLVLNSIVQEESKRMGRRFDLVRVRKENF
jgi:hypothetical protein